MVEKTSSSTVIAYALVIDKPILDLLKITPETGIEVITNGRKLELLPIENGIEQTRFEKALENVNRKFGKVLKRLAD